MALAMAKVQKYIHWHNNNIKLLYSFSLPLFSRRRSSIPNIGEWTNTVLVRYATTEWKYYSLQRNTYVGPSLNGCDTHMNHIVPAPPLKMRRFRY